MKIYDILEKEETMFISDVNGVYMLNNGYNISLQIKELCQSLRTAKDKVIQFL